MNIKIAVCDDDMFFIQKRLKLPLATALKEAGIFSNVDYFSNGNDLIREFENHHPYDIVILDIQMPTINGKDIAEKLRSLDSDFFLIFLTSYNYEIFNTIQYRIYAFISKDAEEKQIISEFKRVFVQYLNDRPDYELFNIIDKNGKTEIKITVNSIAYFHCVNKKIYLSTDRETFQINIRRFSDLIPKYANKGFFELCRGYLVNIAKVKYVKEKDVILDNGSVLPISRGRNKQLLTKMSEYILLRSKL